MEGRDWTPDEIESELVRLEAMVARIRAVQARLVDEADRLRLPFQDGARSLVDWVSARLDVTSSTASDLVRLSRCHDTSDMGDGQVTFDRAVLRRKLADTGASKEAMEASDRFDLAGMRRFVAQHRRVGRADERQAREERRLVFEESLDGETTRFWGRLAGTDGAVVRDALSRLGDTVPRDTAPTRAQRTADALVMLCQGEADPAGGGVAAVVTVDARLAAATDGEAGVAVLSGPRVGPQALEEILCSGTIEVVGIAADGSPLGIGRRSGKIPPRLRRYVLARDGGCTVDGCTSRYRLEVHHRIPYPQGATDPENLTSLCWHHHHVAVHGRGYRLDPESPPGRIRLLPPVQNSPPDTIAA